MNITSTLKIVVDLFKSVQSQIERQPVRNLSFPYLAFCIVSLFSGFSNIFNQRSRQFASKLILIIVCSISFMNSATGQDTDSDGVVDSLDFCVSVGGIVNALGCPFPTVCDTIETATISFDSTGSNNTAGYLTIFVLADSMGVIVDTSSAPLFLNVSAGKYMVTALDYDDDGSLANFAVGDTLDDVTANCFEWSEALTYRICPQEICNDGIDNDEDGDMDCADSDCPAPTATAGSNSAICVGEDLNLTETGGDATSWSWTGPNSYINSPKSNNTCSNCFSGRHL